MLCNLNRTLATFGVLTLIGLPMAANLASAQTQSRSGEVHLHDGTQKTARITAIDSNWRIKAQLLSGEQESLPATDFAYWGRQREASGPMVMLVDGSQIAGDLLRFGRKTLSVGIDYNNFSQRSIWEPSDISLLQVRGIVFQQPGDLAQRDELLAWMSSANAKTDRLRLINGDELSGAALRVAMREPVTGNVDLPPAKQDDEENPSDDGAERGAAKEEEPRRVFWFKMNGRETVAPLEHVRAVALNPALARSSRSNQQRVALGFRDGSCLLARELKVEGNTAIVSTVCGAKLKTSYSRLIKQLTLIQVFGSSRVDYLSDLPAIGYRHVPFLSMAWPKFGADSNVLGGRLRSGDSPFAKGLAMHSVSRLAYQLPDSYARFNAELAIDDLAEDHGSVVFRVYVDKGNGRFAPIYASPIIRGGQPAVSISIDVRDAKRLALIVDHADRGDSGDHANWLNARLIREN